MAEETNTETNNPELNKSYSKEQYDGLKSNLVNQIGELKGQLDTFSKERDDRATKDSELETERLKANDDYKAIIEKNQSEFEVKENEYKTNQAKLENKFNSLQQDNALVTAGITDNVQIAGLKAIYASTEGAPVFGEWLAAQDLASQETGRSSGNAGNVSSKQTEPFVMPTSRADVADMTKEQKAAANQAIRHQARNGNFG